MSARSRTRSTPDLHPYGLLALLIAVLGGGCAIDRGVALPDLADWSSRQAVLADLDDWAFSGRIAVRSGEDGFNGRVRWRQQPGAFSAALSGPLGAGTVQIEGDGRSMTVVDNEGSVVLLADPEADLRRRYGWTIPVDSLRYWVLGIPDPGLPAYLDFGEDGTASRLEQGGWHVEISQYGEGGGQRMPRRINAENGGSRVRLIIDSWVFF